VGRGVLTQPAPAAVLLDTCAALWLVNGDPVTAEGRAAISAAQAGPGVYVSPISAWEIGTLVARGRLLLSTSPERWFAQLVALPGVRLAAMPPEVLIASAFLPGTPPRDPADRIIAATARAFGLVVITRDGALVPYGKSGHLMTIAC
jgi:PIN domain nuclease of toxin-antitoxin system